MKKLGCLVVAMAVIVILFLMLGGMTWLTLIAYHLV